MASYHKFTARRWNAEDQQPGRQVWWNYWDTCLLSEAAYLARWNYVHWNPVRHGLVTRPEDYDFSSYREYYEAQSAATREVEKRFPHGLVTDVPDDF
jgi:putative transposase